MIDHQQMQSKCLTVTGDERKVYNQDTDQIMLKGLTGTVAVTSQY